MLSNLKSKIILLFVLFVTSSYPVSREDKVVYSFRNTDNSDYARMVIVGETVGIDKASILESEKIDLDLLEIGVDLRPDTVTVKVLNNPGIRVGQTLYLIEKNPDHISYKDGNIVGQIKVVSIFHTSFFGDQLRGVGYLRRIENKPMTVAMPLESENLDKAIVLKKQGDYYIAKGDTASAIAYYKKSIKMDPLYPEAHYAMAKVNSESGEGYVSAGFEYRVTWNHRENFSDKNDKFQFHLDYMKYLLDRYSLESRNKRMKVSDLDLCLEVAQEAKLISPANYDLTYHSAEAFYEYYMAVKNLPAITTETPDMNDSVLKKELETSRLLVTKAISDGVHKYHHRIKSSYLYDIAKKSTRGNRAAILEYFMLSAGHYIEEAIVKRPQDYKLQKLAVLFYFEKMNETEVSEGNKTTQLLVEKRTMKKKIEKHGEMYFLYKPKTKKIDKRVKDILDVVHSL